MSLARRSRPSRGTARLRTVNACVAVALAALGSATQAEPATGPALRVVRAGYGNVPVMKEGVARSVEACRIVKHLPPITAALPNDTQLAQLAVLEQEELFDGSHWALYEVQRQFGADPANGCQVALFSYRTGTVEKACELRTTATSAPLGELMSLDTHAASRPVVVDSALSANNCKRKQRDVDLAGLPRQEAGAARCIWSSAIVGRQLAAIRVPGAVAPASGTSNTATTGFDTCLYELRPTYYFEGSGHPVVLMTRTVPRPGTVDAISQVFGEVPAFGNVKLLSFTASPSIAESRFSRSAIDAHVNQPTKSAVGSQS